MGIPKYHKWLTERYPGAFGEAGSERADHVYVDVNALLHDVMRHASSEDDFFSNLFRKLDGLFRTVSPSRSLFLAVDGPASCAKCLTQRQRRREHAQKDARSAGQGDRRNPRKGAGKAGKAAGASRLSNNMLTPGVPFMTKLTAALEYYVASRMPAGRPLATCEWATVSGAHAIGEGEHKIVSQMLRNAGACRAGESHVIFSGDADIFLLSLVQNACRRVRVVSERPQEKGGGKRRPGTMLQVWNAEVLAGRICRELSRGPKVDPGCSDAAAVRRDFALVSLLAGNDYLPELKCGCSPQEIWDHYLSLRRTDFPSSPLLETSPVAEGLPPSHLEGGWALAVLEAGAAFAAEPYEHFAFHQPLLAELMRRATGGGRPGGGGLGGRAAEGVQKYLEGLLWIMEMYHHGYCGDFYFVLERSLHTHASAANIVRLLVDLEAAGAEPLVPPRSEQPPMRPLSCALCILPVQHAEQFLCPGMPQLRPMFATGHPLLGAVNSIETSKELAEGKARVTALQQKMMSLRALGQDDTQVKAELTQCSQRMSELKKGPGGGDIDVVPLRDVDAEVAERCSSKPSASLDFAPDVTLARSAAAEPFHLEAPTPRMPRAQCSGLVYVSGEWPAAEAAEGEAAEGEDPEAVEAEDEAEGAEAGPHGVGDAVEGYWPEDDTWLPASVLEVHPDGSVTIAWDEDGSQSSVPADYVRSAAEEEPEILPPAKRARLTSH